MRHFDIREIVFSFMVEAISYFGIMYVDHVGRL